jgi:hypothetical protein
MDGTAAAAELIAKQAELNPKPKPLPPKQLPANFERLVGAWKRIYLITKKLEPRVTAARKVIVELLIDAGIPVGQHIETKHGSVSLQTQSRTDWEAIARAVVAPAFLEMLVEQFTKTGDPFIRAPHSWAGEAK